MEESYINLDTDSSFTINRNPIFDEMVDFNWLMGKRPTNSNKQKKKIKNRKSKRKAQKLSRRKNRK